MNRNQSCTLAAILFLAASLGGCAPDNSKQAKIEYKVDTSPEATSISPQEAKSKGARGMAPAARPKNYPGPAR